MTNLILSFLITVAAHSQALQTAELPVVRDFEFAPQVETIYYSSAPNRYTSITQFFGGDKANPTGRFCRLDDNQKPFDCIALKVNESESTCTVSQYNEKQPLPITKIGRTDVEYTQLYFQNDIKVAQQPLVKQAIELTKINSVGSARKMAVPQQLTLKYQESILVLQNEYLKNKNQLTAGTIYQAKLACREYFTSLGVQSRFQTARTRQQDRCVTYNAAATRLGSELRNCKTFVNQSSRPLYSKATR